MCCGRGMGRGLALGGRCRWKCFCALKTENASKTCMTSQAKPKAATLTVTRNDRLKRQNGGGAQSLSVYCASCDISCDLRPARRSRKPSAGTRSKPHQRRVCCARRAVEAAACCCPFALLLGVA